MMLCPTRYEAPSANSSSAARAARRPPPSPRHVKMVERSVRIAPIAPILSLPSRSIDNRPARRCAAKRFPTSLSSLHRSTAIGVLDLPGNRAGFGRNYRVHYRGRRERSRDTTTAIAKPSVRNVRKASMRDSIPAGDAVSRQPESPDGFLRSNVPGTRTMEAWKRSESAPEGCGADRGDWTGGDP